MGYCWGCNVRVDFCQVINMKDFRLYKLFETLFLYKAFSEYNSELDLHNIFDYKRSPNDDIEEEFLDYDTLKKYAPTTEQPSGHNTNSIILLSIISFK